MLKIFTKSMIVLTGCLLIGSVALAKQQPTTLGLGHTSTPSNPLPYYCTVTGDTTGNVAFRNYAVMIKGFTGGQLLISATDLNSVYFLSYHDSSFPVSTDGYVVGENVPATKGAVLTCQYGEGSGRSVEPGNYGVSTPTQ